MNSQDLIHCADLKNRGQTGSIPVICMLAPAPTDIQQPSPQRSVFGVRR